MSTHSDLVLNLNDVLDALCVALPQPFEKLNSLDFIHRKESLAVAALCESPLVSARSQICQRHKIEELLDREQLGAFLEDIDFAERASTEIEF